MADKRQPKQKTKPKKGQRLEIRVPKHGDFDDLLKNGARPSDRK
jgi:hypothetical protein